MTSMRERLMLLDRDPEVGTELPTLLKAARKRAGINQGEIASELGVSRQTISTWETGQYVPMRGMVIAWAALTGHKLSPLLRAWDASRDSHIRKEDTRVGVSPRIPFPPYDLDEMPQYSAELYSEHEEVKDALSGRPQFSGGDDELGDPGETGGRARVSGAGGLDRPLLDGEGVDVGLHGVDCDEAWGTAAALRRTSAEAA